MSVRCDNLPVVFLAVITGGSLSYVYSGIGITLSVIILLFNICMRSHVTIKSTSWRVNSITIIGTALIYSVIYFYGLSSPSVASCKEQIDRGTFFSDLNCNSIRINSVATTLVIKFALQRRPSFYMAGC